MLHLFLSSTLFLTGDFHFDLLSLLSIGCFSHSLNISIYFILCPHLSFQIRCRRLRLTLQDQDQSTGNSERHSNKVQKQRRNSFLFICWVKEKKETLGQHFDFSTERRRTSSQKGLHRKQRRRKKHSALQQKRKLKSLRYVSLFSVFVSLIVYKLVPLFWSMCALACVIYHNPVI